MLEILKANEITKPVHFFGLKSGSPSIFAQSHSLFGLPMDYSRGSVIISTQDIYQYLSIILQST